MILHDYTEAADGGSRLCFTLARGLKTPLVLGSIQQQHPYATLYRDVQVRTLAPHVPLQLVRAPLLIAFFLYSTRFIREQNSVIYSGSYAPLAVLRHPARHNILYCHTPPRFLYDDYNVFAQHLAAPVRPFFYKSCKMLRRMYAAAMEHMDLIITNSATVQKRIDRIFGKNSMVIPPPCEIPLPKDASSTSETRTAPLYLSLSRLDPLKRLDVLIKAFHHLPECHLIITSSGFEEKRLRQLAQNAPNITFTGMLPDAAIRALLRSCTATLCVAKDEDFGMCAVESLAFGKPVIAAGSGGLTEIVLHGETGLLLSPNPEPEEVCQAVRQLSPSVATTMRDACMQRADIFSVPRFVIAMRQAVNMCTGATV